MAVSPSKVGANTREEILSQPYCWRECFKANDENDVFERLDDEFKQEAEYLFIGCGSSYYIAQAAATSWELITRTSARAIPASELLLFPDLILKKGVVYRPVLISRSGHSSEVVRAARYLERERKISTLAISCSKNHPLGEIAKTTIRVLPADEESVVMTRSFSSMLLTLQLLAAQTANRKDISKGLRRMPDLVQAIIQSLNARLEEFVQARAFADYVFLAQGPLFPIASEGQLKITEMSCSYAQAFHTLEFRHGPKAIAGPDTLISFLLSESGYDAEREVVEEIKSLGAPTLVIANKADAVTRKCADFLVEFEFDVPECARLAGYLIPCQLLGFYLGIKKGYDIDNPRNLSRAVILDSIATE